MNVTFLGTGTSHGVPSIGCTCAVCTSSDLRNRRRRCSLYVKSNETSIVIDTPPDFRDQVLTFGVPRVDAVLLTHAHADHVNGFDDLRAFGFHQGAAIPVHASEETVEVMKKMFYYVFEEPTGETTVPNVEFNAISEHQMIGDIMCTPIPVMHGSREVYGYRLDSAGKGVAYVPDCSDIPESSLELLRGLNVMILDATRTRPHPTHFSVQQSVEMLKMIGARQSFITHMCHDIDHEVIQAEMPEKMYVPYDGLTLMV